MRDKRGSYALEGNREGEWSGTESLEILQEKTREVRLTVSGSCDYCGSPFLLNISGMYRETDTHRRIGRSRTENRAVGRWSEDRVRRYQERSYSGWERLIKGGNIWRQ